MLRLVKARPTTPALNDRQFASSIGWVNDPNGLVYLDGEYHLFYQLNPHSRVWGPMHWGHAVSTDLERWDELPIALEPDELGWIFSGSIVADVDNRAGLSREGETVLIAFFTHHDPEGKAAGHTDYEHQSLAVSHDKGRSWTKHAGNPVLTNPGDAPDFRDPSVFWHDRSAAWVMLISAGDKLQIHRSTNLFDWTWASSFDAGRGAGLGLWECSYLCEMPIEGENERRWVLIQSFNPGGRLGGSGTRYFVGDFDGFTFTPAPDFDAAAPAADNHWLDWGPDNYAMIGWANLPATHTRPLFIGWMNNWAYANETTEEPFRGRMIMPREAHLARTPVGLRLRARPKFVGAPPHRCPLNGPAPVARDRMCHLEAAVRVQPGSTPRLTLEAEGETLASITYCAAKDVITIDRRAAHPTGAADGLAGQFDLPRLATSDMLSLSLYVSPFGLELFIDEGAQAVTVQLDASRCIDRVSSDGFEPTRLAD